MRTFPSFLVAAALLTTSLLLPTSARADGAVVRRLPDASAHASLTADIAKARQASPDSFQALDRIAARLPDLDQKRRGRLLPVTPLLKALGSRGLMPMLERAAVQSPARGSLSDVAWLSWRIGLIEATGIYLQFALPPLDGDAAEPMNEAIAQRAVAGG